MFLVTVIIFHCFKAREIANTFLNYIRALQQYNVVEYYTRGHFQVETFDVEGSLYLKAEIQKSHQRRKIRLWKPWVFEIA
jgi:hypothetical protein